VGRSLAGLIAPHCRAELGLHLRIASSRGRHAFPTIHRARDGEEFPVTASVVFDGAGFRYGVGAGT
jgi:hypothetical protein